MSALRLARHFGFVWSADIPVGFSRETTRYTKRTGMSALRKKIATAARAFLFLLVPI
jgi:hypothetical protein